MEYFNAEPSGSERKYIIVAKLDTILLEHLAHATNSQISIKFGKENVSFHICDHNQSIWRSLFNNNNNDMYANDLSQ